MTLLAVALLCFAAALAPALLYARNRTLYRLPPVPAAHQALPHVSVLIPARNEEASIAGAVESALASKGIDLEVIVLNDHSDDGTADIVSAIAAQDPRVRLEHAPPLPAGWCGKQHACHVLAGLARYPVLAFIDADVRLAPDGLARAVAFLETSAADLASGIPFQQTGTVLEKLLIPLIHLVLLGYLPIARMRRSTLPAYGAGCGQLFLARREAYDRAGGHAAIRESMHDGITLPRTFRRAGLKTDLFDATEIATCRMYRGPAEVWRGLRKNATEGIASPGAIVPWTLILLAGHVLPGIVAILSAAVVLRSKSTSTSATIALVLSTAAVLASYVTRFALAFRFRQSRLGAALHPTGVLLLLVIQWQALFRRLTGRPSAWKGRAYNPAAAAVSPSVPHPIRAAGAP